MKKTTLTAIIISAAICTAFSGCASAVNDGDGIIYSDNSSVTVGSYEAESSESSESSEGSETDNADEQTQEEISANTRFGGRGTRFGGNNKNGGAGFGTMQGRTTSSTVTSDTQITVQQGSSALDTSDLFSKRDLSQTADTTDAKTVKVSDGKTITITEEGVYIVKGSAKNCTIIVEADKSAKVQLVLDGVSITNEDFPAIYVKSADKCFITTTTAESTLSVTGTFKSDGDTNTDAVIYSKDDIVFNGKGTLNITSSQGNGISGKDDVKFTGGAYNITSANHGIEANDSISICGGTFKISSKKDAVHCKNSDDGSVGWIYISDGEFDLTASSDGIQATTILQIDGGSFDISSSEGLEASYIQINGGTVSISASDDGINAARKSTAITTPTVEFNGGEINITMGSGDTDAVDANGNIYVNGGTVNITAPTSAFDYDGTGELNGGTVTVNGSRITQLTQSMMGGGRGGFGGMGGFGGGEQGGFGGRNSGMNGNNGMGGFGGRAITGGMAT